MREAHSHITCKQSAVGSIRRYSHHHGSL